MIHSGFARRWMSEQRKKKIRRFYYAMRDNLLDYIGIGAWSLVVIMITACGIFVLWHR